MLYTLDDLQKFINKNSEEKYRDFIKKIVRTSYKLNGVRMPLIKSQAKLISKCDNARDVLDWECECYEQVAIQGYLLGALSRRNDFFELVDIYIKRIDDWSLCDGACCAVKRKDDEYFYKCKDYAASNDEWRVRWGLVGIMTNFCDKDVNTLLSVLEKVEQGKYYVDMALAWLLQVLAAKYRDKAEFLIKNLRLSEDVKKMTAGKIRDSFRIDSNQKSYFRDLLK